jgi:hypothetical protein
MHERSWSLRPLDARQPIAALIAVALKEPPAEALQESLGMLTAAARRIAEQHDRRTLAPTSCSTDMTQPRSARIAALSFVASTSRSLLIAAAR